MRIGTTRACHWLAALLLISPTAVIAAPPEGPVQFDFPDPIYDLGTISESAQLAELGYVVDLTITLDMQVDGKGKYSGDAMLEFLGDITGVLSGPATGKYNGKSDKEKGEFKIKKATGDLTINSATAEAQIDLNCDGPIEQGVMEGKCKLKVKIPGQGSASERVDVLIPLAEWAYSIVIDFVPIDEKKFEGTATDTLGFGYEVSGTYNSKKGTSKVSAKGNKKDDNGDADPSKGAKVDIKDMNDLFEGEGSAKVGGADFKKVPLAGTPIMLLP